MNRCQEILPLLSCRASGPLDRDDEALVSEHLEQCGSCRAELEREEALLAELALPPPSPELSAAVERLSGRAATQWRRGERRRHRALQLLGASAAAAALIASVLAPAWLRDRAYTRAHAPGEVAAAASPPARAAPADPRPAARLAGPASAAAPAAAVQLASWDGPDLDEAWEASAVVGGDSGAEVAMSDEGTIFDSSSSP